MGRAQLAIHSKSDALCDSNTLTSATPENLPMLEASAVERIRPTTVIMTNQSERAIVGLSVKWTYIDESGKSLVHTHSSDSYAIRNSNVVLAPYSRLLIAPGVFLPESLMQKPHVGPGLESLDGRDSPAATTASQITVQIDCLIFEDGQVVGPNESHYDAEILGRKTAAEQIAQQVRSAQVRGQEPAQVLHELLEHSLPQPDFTSSWMKRYARKLLKAPVFERQLAALEAMPKLPAFYTRKEGKQ